MARLLFLPNDDTVLLLQSDLGPEDLIRAVLEGVSLSIFDAWTTLREVMTTLPERIVLAGGGQKEAHAFLDALEIFGLGYSWGGYESLAVPVFLGDRVIAKGPYEGPLIRLQIGLEDVGDLKADLEKGLAAAMR